MPVASPSIASYSPLLLSGPPGGPLPPDLSRLARRLVSVARPYWVDSEAAGEARLRLAGLFALTLLSTGVSVGFNFLGRDFFNALSAKDADLFYQKLGLYLCGFGVGIPIFVVADYYQGVLGLRWRDWLTRHFLGR